MVGKTVLAMATWIFPAYFLNMAVHTDPGYIIISRESPLAYLSKGIPNTPPDVYIESNPRGFRHKCECQTINSLVLF